MRKPEETFYGRLDLHLYWTCPDLSEPLQGCPYDLFVLSSFFLKRKCFEKGSFFLDIIELFNNFKPMFKRTVASSCKGRKGIKLT